MNKFKQECDRKMEKQVKEMVADQMSAQVQVNRIPANVMRPKTAKPPNSPRASGPISPRGRASEKVVAKSPEKTKGATMPKASRP